MARLDTEQGSKGSNCFFLMVSGRHFAAVAELSGSLGVWASACGAKVQEAKPKAASHNGCPSMFLVSFLPYTGAKQKPHKRRDIFGKPVLEKRRDRKEDSGLTVLSLDVLFVSFLIDAPWLSRPGAPCHSCALGGADSWRRRPSCKEASVKTL